MAPGILKKIKRKIRGKNANSDVKEVAKGSSLAFAYRIVTMFASYALMWLVSRLLGDSGIGIYNLSVALLGILVMVSSLGFNTSVVRFVAQFRAAGKIGAIEQLYYATIKATLPLSLLMGALLYFGAEMLATQFYHDSALVRPFQLCGIILPFFTLQTNNVEFIRGLKFIHFSEAFRNLSLQLINLILVGITAFWALNSTLPVLYYGVAIAISALATHIFIIRFFRKHRNDIPATRDPHFSLKMQLLVSLPMILTSFIQLLNGKVDTLMIGVFKTTAIVGIFSVAFKISVITNFVIGALKTITMPKISELFFSNKFEELNSIMQYANKVTFLFSAPVSVIMFFFPEFLLSLVNPEFVSGANTLRIFAVMQLFNASSGMVAAFLNMTGHQVYFTRLVAISTALNIGLNWLLIPKYGMEGAAAATLVSVLLWNIIGASFIYRKYKIATFYWPFGKAAPLH